MGFYWKTYFYPDYGDKTIKIALAYIDPIIDANDVARGYVDRNELLKYYAGVIGDYSVGEDSRVVEEISDTYGDEVEVTKIMPVK